MKLKLIFGLLSSLLLIQFSYAQDAENNVVTNKWTLQCPKQAEGKPTQCFTMTTLRSPQNKNYFASVAISKPVAEQLPTMQITTPLGVMLNQGINIQVGQSKVNKVPYNFCIAAGCITTANVADDIMVSLNSSDQLALQFVLIGKRAANVNLDLKGFSDVYASMVIEQEKLNNEFIAKKAE